MKTKLLKKLREKYFVRVQGDNYSFYGGYSMIGAPDLKMLREWRRSYILRDVQHRRKVKKITGAF